MVNKVLVVFCDGTGMDGVLTDPGECIDVFSLLRIVLRLVYQSRVRLLVPVPRTPVTIPRTSCDFVNHRIQVICYQPADFIEIARAVRSHNAYAVLLLTRME